MRTRIAGSTIAFVLLVGASPLFAHEAHCHLKGADGKVTDAADAKDKKACAAKGGEWTHHHAHCHKSDADGKAVDLPKAKSEKACEKAGGRWTDHAHEDTAK